MRWRRARNLIGYWAADGFRLENPLVRRTWAPVGSTPAARTARANRASQDP